MVLCRFVAGYGYLTLPSDYMGSEHYTTDGISEIFYGLCYILIGLGASFFQRRLDVSSLTSNPKLATSSSGLVPYSSRDV